MKEVFIGITGGIAVGFAVIVLAYYYIQWLEYWFPYAVR